MKYGYARNGPFTRKSTEKFDSSLRISDATEGFDTTTTAIAAVETTAAACARTAVDRLRGCFGERRDTYGTSIGYSTKSDCLSTLTTAASLRLEMRSLPSVTSNDCE